jgi:site-specific recombinase XerC
MLVQDYVRPATVKVGILEKDDPRRFGFHNLRHSLASFLVRAQTNPKTVQELLRYAKVKTTPQSTRTAIWRTGGRPRARRLRQF